MEEIIIDGVDVAGCEYFKINNGFNCYKGHNCTDKESSDCYYKQLKRLEQENAELKEKIKKYAAINEQETKDYAELKADNARLKAQLDVLEEDNKKLSSENDALYNNSLQEVKEDLVKRVWNLQKQYAEVVNQFEIESLTDKTTGETIYRSNVVNKLKELLELRIEDLCESCGASSMMPMPCTVYKQALQEIKAIAEDAYENESEYQATGVYNEILQKITKAEEE